MLKRAIFVALAGGLLATAGLGQEAPRDPEAARRDGERRSETTEAPRVPPELNARFLDPNLDVDEWVKRFESESREVFAARAAILAAMELKPGMRVADVGAGTGLYTVLMAEAVGRAGWVYAVEISPRFAEHLARLAEGRSLHHVTPVLCTERSVRLAPESIDLAFVCDTYHHFAWPEDTLASIRSALRPGGRLVVLDFERVPGQSKTWILEHVRAGKQVVCQEIEAAGFEKGEEKRVAGLRENYLVVFRKPTGE